MGFEIHHGDCVDVMREMGGASVDAVVTDPPYGIGFDYGEHYEDEKDPVKYWAWLKPRFEEIKRVVKPGGLIAIWQAQLYFPHFWEWFGRDIHIYCAAKNFVQLRKTAINYGYDPVVMFYKPGAEALRPTKPPRNVDFFVANTAAVVSDTTRLERVHPCPRPLDVVREIVANFTVEGGVVLDPFAGSFTTGAACIATGRYFIGIEQNQFFCELGEARIKRAQGIACDIPRPARTEKYLPLFAEATA